MKKQKLHTRKLQDFNKSSEIVVRITSTRSRYICTLFRSARKKLFLTTIVLERNYLTQELLSPL